MAILSRNLDICACLGRACTLDLCCLLPRDGTSVAAINESYVARSSKETKASTVYYEWGECFLLCPVSYLGRLNACKQRYRRF